MAVRAEQRETPARRQLRQERSRLVHQVARLLDGPMTALAFVWLGLLILDLTRGLSAWLAALNYVIWGLFIAHFALEFFIAPSKGEYLRKNWLTAVSLLLPALRVLRVFRAFRVLRAARAARSTGLLRVLTSLNRGMKATRRALRRHGVGYVIALTLLVTFAGAAGMYSFENPASLRDAGFVAAGERGGLDSYGEAVWWTAMVMTTMGSEYWPRTAEGRLLALLLAVYAFAIFGYITATIASYFVGSKRAEPTPAAPDLQAEVAALRTEVAGLLAELRRR